MGNQHTTPLTDGICDTKGCENQRAKDKKQGVGYWYRSECWSCIGKRRKVARGTSCSRYLTKDNWTVQLFREANKRSKVKGLEYTLTQEDENYLVRRCKGKSEWGKKEFNFEKDDDFFHRPWIPSLDRIDSKKGYTRDNVRILNVWENNALGQFGSEVAVEAMTAILNNCLTRCIK